MRSRESKILLENAGEAADAFYLFFQNKYAAQMQNLYVRLWMEDKFLWSALKEGDADAVGC